MFEINCNVLNDYINKLNEIIQTYDELNEDICLKLRDSIEKWHDNNSVRFLNYTNNEKNETRIFLNSLYKSRDLYRYIYMSYNEIGNKIKINLENKKTILNLFYEVQNCFNSVVSAINRVKTSGDYNYNGKREISNKKNELKNALNKINNLEANVTRLYSNLETIKNEINSRLNNLNLVDISSFEYNLM